jgi:hypothetical protein
MDTQLFDSAFLLLPGAQVTLEMPMDFSDLVREILQ